MNDSDSSNEAASWYASAVCCKQVAKLWLIVDIHFGAIYLSSMRANVIVATRARIFSSVIPSQSWPRPEQYSSLYRRRSTMSLMSNKSLLLTPQCGSMSSRPSSNIELTPFENTNVPRGYVYKPWTIEELEVQRNKDKIELPGDWS